MSIIFYIVNGMVMPPAMFFAWNFYKYKGNEIKFRKLWISIGIFSLTFIVTSLQFIFPEIVPALNRDSFIRGGVAVGYPPFHSTHGYIAMRV